VSAAQPAGGAACLVSVGSERPGGALAVDVSCEATKIGPGTAGDDKGEEGAEDEGGAEELEACDPSAEGSTGSCAGEVKDVGGELVEGLGTGACEVKGCGSGEAGEGKGQGGAKVEVCDEELEACDPSAEGSTGAGT